MLPQHQLRFVHPRLHSVLQPPLQVVLLLVLQTTRLHLLLDVPQLVLSALLRPLHRAKLPVSRTLLQPQHLVAHRQVHNV